MKKILPILGMVGALSVVSFGATPAQFGGKVGKDCTFKGKRLWGNIKIVENFPDIRVKIIRNFPDLRVKKVTSFPSRCGEWKIVNNLPDIRVQYVNIFPGVP